MTIVNDQKTIAFVETDNKFQFQGKTFESGGSFLTVNPKTGKLQGIMYEYENENKVGSWHGDIKVNARFGRPFDSNFRDCQGRPVQRRYCWFTYQGKNFIGINYNLHWQSCITVSEVA